MPLRNLENEISEYEKHDLIIIGVSLFVIFFCFFLINTVTMEKMYIYTAKNMFTKDSGMDDESMEISQLYLTTKQKWSLRELFKNVGETAEKKAFLEGILIDLALLLMIFEVMLHVHKLESEVLKEEREIIEEEVRIEEELREVEKRERILEQKELELEKREDELEREEKEIEKRLGMR